MRLCVSNGRIVDPSLWIDAPGTLWIEDATIAAIELEDRLLGCLPDNAEVLARDALQE